MLNPIDNEELFQSIVLGGVRSPGKVEQKRLIQPTQRVSRSFEPACQVE